MAGLESAPRPPVRAAERIRPRFPFFHRNRVVLSIQNHHFVALNRFFLADWPAKSSPEAEPGYSGCRSSLAITVSERINVTILTSLGFMAPPDLRFDNSACK